MLPVTLQWLSSPRKWTPQSKQWLPMLGMRAEDSSLRRLTANEALSIWEKCTGGCELTHKDAVERCAQWPSQLFFLPESRREGCCNRCSQMADTTERVAKKIKYLIQRSDLKQTNTNWLWVALLQLILQPSGSLLMQISTRKAWALGFCRGTRSEYRRKHPSTRRVRLI